MPETFFAKIITIGDGGVGKTTMLHRYKEGEFKDDTQMTYGVDFFVKELEIEGTKLLLQIWDLGGQDQFRFLHNERALGIKGGIFMFDLTRIDTLGMIEEWISLCRNR